MSMLAEAKTKPSWVLNPRASDWSKDQNKLGQKMLEKMGWSAGKGLGAKEQGPVEAIRIKYKGDSRGLGAGRKKEQEDWLQQQESFQSLLEGLNGTSDKSVSVRSLEEKSKTTRTKIHYHKFARGKDISRYSEKDLSCIVGSGFVPIKLPETENLTPKGNSVFAISSLNNDGSPCIDSDTGDHCTSSEGSMNRERSRTGRELKPSAKVAALYEEGGSPQPKKKIKEKPTTGFVSLSKSSKRLNAEHQSDKPSKKGGKLKPTSPTLEQMPSSPKKKETKGKSTGPTPQLENGPSTSESSGDHKDREHSRSGRTYKPTAKIATGLEISPSPKKKKTKDKSTALQPEIESGSESTKSATSLVKSPKKKKTKDKSTELLPEKEYCSESATDPEKSSVRSRSRREHKPSAKVLASWEESPSPKKKKTKDKSTASLPENESCSESATDPEKSSVRSRSRREYKPSAKSWASWEEGSPSHKKKKTKGKLTEVEEDVQGKAGSSKTPDVSSAADASHSRCGREYKPSAIMKARLEETFPEPYKTSKAKISSETKETARNVAEKKRQRIPSESSSSQAKIKKQKPPKEGESSLHKTSKNKVSSDDSRAGMTISSKSFRKRLPPSGSNEVHEGTERMKSKRTKNDVAIKKTIKNDNPELDVSEGEEHSPRKRLKGKNKNVVSMDTEPSEESPKPRKKRKEKRAEESAVGEPSSSSAVSLASTSERLKSSGNVENGVADEQDAELPEDEPKRKRKQKGKVGESSENKTDGQEEPPSKERKKEKKKKKAEKPDPEPPEAGDNEEGDGEATEPPSKTRKKKKNQNVEEPEDEEKRPKVTKSLKNVDKSAAKVDRKESSESQDTVVSKGQDSEDNMEELASINSQSSLICEMIGSAPSALKVGDEPEELRKFHILASDNEGDD